MLPVPSKGQLALKLSIFQFISWLMANQVSPRSAPSLALSPLRSEGNNPGRYTYPGQTSCLFLSQSPSREGESISTPKGLDLPSELLPYNSWATCYGAAGNIYFQGQLST